MTVSASRSEGPAYFHFTIRGDLSWWRMPCTKSGSVVSGRRPKRKSLASPCLATPVPARPMASGSVTGIECKVLRARRPRRRREPMPCESAPQRVPDKSDPSRTPQVAMPARMRKADLRTNRRGRSMHHSSRRDGQTTTRKRVIPTSPQGCRMSRGCRRGMRSLSTGWGAPLVSGCCMFGASAGGVGSRSKPSRQLPARAVDGWSTWRFRREAGEFEESTRE